MKEINTNIPIQSYGEMKREDERGEEEEQQQEEQVDDDNEEEQCEIGKQNDLKLRLKSKGLLSYVRKRSGVGGDVGPTNRASSSTPVLPWKEDDDDGSAFFVCVCGRGHQTIIDRSTTTSYSSSFTTKPSFPIFLSPYPDPPPFATGSVRKAGVAVWEFFQYLSPHHNTMQSRCADADLFHHYRRYPDGADDHHKGNSDHVLPKTKDHHPATASGVRRQVAALLSKHHRSADRNHHHVLPLSPASYGSSLEVTPFNPARTPTSSVEFKARINGEPSYSFKTSTELLKVLNRIWTLEEQHISNTSFIKALKTELDHAHSRIKKLLRDQQATRCEIDELMKRLSQDKMARKSREEDMFESAIQTMRHDLENERKLRMRSEGLHRRLAREIFEVKVALSASVKEVKKEWRSRYILEELCDEFANEIKGYQRKLNDMKQKSSKSWPGMDERDLMILHMCELWLNERCPMKEAGGGEDHCGDSPHPIYEPVADKLRNEIENFLKTRRLGSITPLSDTREVFHARRSSLESFPLNEAGSAPRLMGNEDSTLGRSPTETRKMENSSFDTHEKKPTCSGSRKGKTHVNLKEEAIDAAGIASQEQHHQNKNNQKSFDSETATTAEVPPPPVDVRSSTAALQQRREKAKVGGEEDRIDERSSIVSKPMSELLRSESGGKYDNIRKWLPSMGIAFPGTESAESSSKTASRCPNALKLNLLEPKARGGRRSRLKRFK